MIAAVILAAALWQTAPAGAQVDPSAVAEPCAFVEMADSSVSKDACEMFVYDHHRMPTPAELQAAIAEWNGITEACDRDTNLTTDGTLVCEFFYRKHGRKPTPAELQAAEPEWDRATTKALLTPEVRKRARELERCEDSGACTTVYVSPW